MLAEPWWVRTELLPPAPGIRARVWPRGTGLTCSPSPRWGPLSFPQHKEPLAARRAARWHSVGESSTCSTHGLLSSSVAQTVRPTTTQTSDVTDGMLADVSLTYGAIFPSLMPAPCRSRLRPLHQPSPAVWEERRVLCCGARPSRQEPPQPGEGLDPGVAPLEPCSAPLALLLRALAATARSSWQDLGTPPRASTSPSPSLGCSSVENCVFYLYVSGFI